MWKVVKALQMQLLGEILGQFISVGVIVLIIVFQPEIRQFLLLLGNARFIRTEKAKEVPVLEDQSEDPFKENIDTIVHACKKMADTKTGALIVITRENELRSYVETGQTHRCPDLGTTAGKHLLQKQPLHDGAVIISGDEIRAARCILPVSNNSSVPVIPWACVIVPL